VVVREDADVCIHLRSEVVRRHLSDFVDSTSNTLVVSAKRLWHRRQRRRTRVFLDNNSLKPPNHIPKRVFRVPKVPPISVS
jgi:hypothetical protein